MTANFVCNRAGVGPEIGEALAKRYPTAQAMYRELAECKAGAQQRGSDPEAACLKLISEVSVNLSRSVGMSAAKSIFTQLFAEL